MNHTTAYFRDLRQSVGGGWNRFWFTPTDPATLGLIRILTGAMLVYTHLVWTLGLDSFLSDDGQLSIQFSKAYHDSSFAWSYLYWVKSAGLLWTLHIIGILVLLLFTLGVATRITGVLSFLITVAYANRAVGSLYGLDQINGFLTLYLAVGPSGACFSLEHCWRRRQNRANAVQSSIGANVSIRLMQLHMCLLYFVAGLAKLRTDEWWDGQAIWYVFANYEYQTVDMVWLGRFPWLIDFLTHATIVFEVGYIALIWPRITRPLYLAMAVVVHLTIGICVGMITFGLIMIVANLSFLRPSFVRSIAGCCFRSAREQPPDAVS